MLVGIPLAVLVALGMVYAGIGPTAADIKCGDQSRFERAFYGDRLGAVAFVAGCRPEPGSY